MKAMLLAAGKGTRMGELTRHTPKPLLKVKGEPLILHLVRKLALSGFSEIVINVSYLGNQIEQTLGNGQQFGVSIAYSREEEPLDTGGGIYNALALLGSKPFVVISADIWTDFPLAELKTCTNQDAHLVMVENPPYNLAGDFSLSSDGVIEFGREGVQSYTYGNIGVFNPGIFADCAGGIIKFRDIIDNPISQGRVSGQLYCGEWVNVGTPEILAQLNNMVAQGEG